LVHAHDDEKREEFVAAYRAFVINFRAAVERLRGAARQITDLFPDWAFPPAPVWKPAVSSARQSPAPGCSPG
jgi:hypothetical protein